MYKNNLSLISIKNNIKRQEWIFFLINQKIILKGTGGTENYKWKVETSLQLNNHLTKRLELHGSALYTTNYKIS